RMLVCHVNDGTGRLTRRCFNCSAGQKHALSAVTILRCFGAIRRGRVGFEMTQPEYSLSDTLSEQQTNTTLPPGYP
ncbi:OB-fold nucleic acid binding domain-containing protein, partial [Pseudoalteromonas sp. S1650]|uniref:OB-fold nucleic acid binding domain-containing protein n=1 Tax=Pseudoalteromonas sp. S1650 TaxID=579509 RepID=UPI0012742D7C